MKRLYRELPNVVRVTLLQSEGWLVGSSVQALIDNKPVNDYDIIVPDTLLYMRTVATLGAQAKKVELNSFGGMKFFFKGGVDIDIWPEELDHFLKASNSLGMIYNVSKNILLEKK